MPEQTDTWRPDAEPWEALREADARAGTTYSDAPSPLWERQAEALSEMGWRLVPLVRLRELEADLKRLRDKYLPTIDDVRGILRTDRQPEVADALVAAAEPEPAKYPLEGGLIKEPCENCGRYHLDPTFTADECRDSDPPDRSPSLNPEGLAWLDSEIKSFEGPPPMCRRTAMNGRSQWPRSGRGGPRDDPEGGGVRRGREI